VSEREGWWDGERVAALRRRLGISQSEFAARLGVRQQTVSEWEVGRYRPRGASVRLLGMFAEDATDYDARPPADGGGSPPPGGKE
jgi:DNA-binding transcriptional regulator YiaG